MCSKQVLNLFLALLLSNFGSSNLSAPTADNDTNKIAEAIDRIARFIKWIKRNILAFAKLMRAKLTNQISDQAPGEGPSNSWKEGLYPIRSLAVCAVQFVALSFSFCFTLLSHVLLVPVGDRYNKLRAMTSYELQQRQSGREIRSYLLSF